MPTELDNIEKILIKYLDAKTDLQEEALLKNYFNSDKVAPHLQEYQYMFQYFNKSKAESYTKNIRFESFKPKPKWIGVAASIAVILSVFLFNNYREKQAAQQAYKDTQATLQLIATHMNKGGDAIEQLNTFTITKHKIFKLD